MEMDNHVHFKAVVLGLDYWNGASRNISFAKNLRLKKKHFDLILIKLDSQIFLPQLN